MVRELFASRLRVVAAVALVLAASVGGALVTGVVGAPSVTGVENRFGAVNESRTVVHTDLHVRNPNPIGVRLGGTTVNYTVAMNGVVLASGEKDGVHVESGNATLSFVTSMDNRRIPDWWVTHVRNGETTRVRVDARVHSSLLGRTFAVPQERTVETDVIGQFRSTEDRPVRADSPLAPDPVLIVRETDARWGAVTDERTPIETQFVVYNPNASPYVLTEIGYEVTMNDVPVGSGASERSHVIEPGTEEAIDATTAIRNARLDEWWVSHLERNQVTDLRIDFYATLELPSGATIRLPLDSLTYEKTIETDVFGTKDAADGAEANASAEGGVNRTTAGGSDAGEGDGDSSAATPSESNGSASSAPTDEPDDGSSPTDDGTDGGDGDDGGLLSALSPARAGN
ncbi:LEA type 2 family protein [Halomarina pelagica]|uniref:LEA type 2 family protein n=1 Tax=Halomarina pelagica TaxID=2961599 RepID=UPI0020C406E6|nr:LEA type 2 family protein [Halomarina sp. BND7]